MAGKRGSRTKRKPLSKRQIARLAGDLRADLSGLSAAEERAVWRERELLYVSARRRRERHEIAEIRAGDIERQRALRESERAERRYERSLAGREEARAELVEAFEHLTRLGLYEPRTKIRRGKGRTKRYVFTPAQRRYIRDKGRITRQIEYDFELVRIPGSGADLAEAKATLRDAGYEVHGRHARIRRLPEFTHRIGRDKSGRLQMHISRPAFEGRRRKTTTTLYSAGELSRLERRAQRAYERAGKAAGPKGKVALVVKGKTSRRSYGVGQWAALRKDLARYKPGFLRTASFVAQETKRQRRPRRRARKVKHRRGTGRYATKKAG